MDTDVRLVQNFQVVMYSQLQLCCDQSTPTCYCRSESGDLRSEASADKDAHPPTLAGQQEGASESTQVAAALANAGQGGQAHASDKDDPLL